MRPGRRDGTKTFYPLRVDVSDLAQDWLLAIAFAATVEESAEGELALLLHARLEARLLGDDSRNSLAHAVFTTAGLPGY